MDMFLAIPVLLKSLGVKNIKIINSEINGNFAHNPEPLDKNLVSLSKEVINYRADIGLAVDPDVDRLAIIDEKGNYIGEEYSLVAVADYIFANFDKLKGSYNKVSVSNLSSSRALKDISLKYKGRYKATAVGEVNVILEMKKNQAVIGGEGNGGIIYPYLNYGRDALVGIALLLSYLSIKKEKISKIRRNLPNYFMIKDKLNLIDKDNLYEIFALIKDKAKQEKIEINEIDGLKIDWPDLWLHLRASNTEPIIRIYAEAKEKKIAKKKIEDIKKIISSYIK
jgi:phosphomannomutase